MELAGAYTADRAAALSGVPRSTVHYWASHDILTPSVSSQRVKLWSFADLLALRVIYWGMDRSLLKLDASEVAARELMSS
jgi:DNA-binding transcriptional MerR regulator